MLWRSPGVSLRSSQAITRVKAGLKVSRGLTSEASAFASAEVESSVAAQLQATERSKAATKIPSMCGTCVVQESDVIEHWVSSSVPAARMGSEAALMAQATSGGRASRRICLFRIGRNEVRTVATSARRADMLPLYVTSETIRLMLFLV